MFKVCNTCLTFFEAIKSDFWNGFYSKELSKIISKDEFDNDELSVQDLYQRISDSCYNGHHLILR